MLARGTRAPRVGHEGDFPITRFKTFAALVVFAPLALAGCKAQESASDAAPSAQNAQAVPSVEVGRLVLPSIKGKPASAYFVLKNSSFKPVTLTAVAIAGVEKAELHTTNTSLTTGKSMSVLPTLEVPSGGTAVFAPYIEHVMAYNPSDDLKLGAKTEMTLTFADGATLTAPLVIESDGALPTR